MTITYATTLSALALTTLLASVTASAADERARLAFAPETVTLKVRIDDLDPTTPRGARALYRRIVIAAERICMPPRDHYRGVRRQKALDQAATCFDAAVAEAVAEVGDIANVDIEQLAKLDRRAKAELAAAR